MNYITLLIRSLVVVILIWCAFKLTMMWYKLNHDLAWLPGPRALPLLGNLTHLIGIDGAAVVDVMHKWHKKYGSFYKFWTGPEPIVVIQDPDLIKTLSNSGKLALKSVEYDHLSVFCGESLLTSAGDVWSRKRKIIAPCFYYDILDGFMECMNKKAAEFTKHLHKYTNGVQTFNFLDYSKLYSIDVLMETLMGVQIKALENGNNVYIKAIEEMQQLIMTRNLSALQRFDVLYNLLPIKKKSEATAKVLQNYVDNVIKIRREMRNQNIEHGNAKQKGGRKFLTLIDMFLDINESTIKIENEEIRNEVNTIMFAGHDTTSVALAFTVYSIGRNEEIQDNVYKEITEKVPHLMETGLSQNDLKKLDYLDRCVKEALRMFPPVPLLGKRFEQPFLTEKGVISSKVAIVENVHHMHNDENLYPRPHVFDPDRFLPENVALRDSSSYIPFSKGARNCIGQKYAHMELMIALSYLFANYKIEAIQNLEDLNLAYEIVLIPKNGIYIKMQKRK